MPYPKQQSAATRLPPELLFRIFLLCKEKPHTSDVYGGPTPDDATKNVINVSQVCRRWHYVAISDPVLWHDVADFKKVYKNTYDNWIQVLLKRSEPVPIHAEVSFVDGEKSHRGIWRPIPIPFSVTPNMKLLLAHSQRIGQLTVIINAFDFQKATSYYEQKLLPSAPNLKVLNYEVNKDGPRGFIDSGFYCIHLIKKPFLPLNNELEELKLFNIKFTPSVAQQVLSNLSVLEVSFGVYEEYNISTTTKDWLAILGNMPRLRRLKLEDWVMGEWRVSPGTSTIQLPNLEVLSLDRAMEDCVDFLNYVKFPVSTVVFLRCRDIVPGNDWKAFSTCLTESFDFAARGEPIGHVFIRLDSTLLVSVQEPQRLTLELCPSDEFSFCRFRYYDPFPTAWMSVLKDAKQVFIDFGNGSEETSLEQAAVRSFLRPFESTKSITVNSIDVFLYAFEAREEKEKIELYKPVSTRWINNDIAGKLLPSVRSIRTANRHEHREPFIRERVLDFVRRRMYQECRIRRLEMDIYDNLPKAEGYDNYIQALENLSVMVDECGTEEIRRRRELLWSRPKTYDEFLS